MWLHILLCVIKKNPVQETLIKLNLEASMKKTLLPFLIYSSLLSWDLLAALILSELNGDAKRGCMCGKPHLHLKLTGWVTVTWPRDTHLQLT
jgi:hypothetical protein